nr:DUF86 domain-containing protein [Desulfatitalea alkaliphila]
MILRKISEFEQYYQQISEFRGTSTDAYRADWKLQRIIERTLQMMIETCVDIAGHIISDQGFRLPDSYADTFRVLHENTIIDGDLCRTLEKIAKFRNIIVHHYDRVDVEIVVGILRKHLDDFHHFQKAIINWLKTK